MSKIKTSTTTTAGVSTWIHVRTFNRYPAGGADERKLRRSTQNTGHSWTIIVFLDGGVEEPDTMSLELLKSGDIERNPGPSTRSLARSTREKCGKCSAEFSNNAKPLTCIGCNMKFCKTKFACTGTTRWKIDKITSQGTGWACMRCTSKAKNSDRVQQPETSETEDDSPTIRKCGKCKDKLTDKANH